MIGSELLGRLDRLQQSLQFKIVASIVLAVLAIGVWVTYTVSVHSQDPDARAAATAPADPPPATPPPPRQGGPRPAAGDAAEVDPALARLRSAEEITTRAIDQIVARRADTTAIGVGCVIGLGVCLLVVWLGLGLTYLGLLLVTALVVAPLLIAGNITPTSTRLATLTQRLHDAGKFLGAVVVLTASFAALMQGLKLSLGGKGPVLAVARNVVNEAVRMKVSLVFIVMLVFALAALPGLLNESTPLRYRVQSFLQYGTGGAFWIIAVLVLFLSVGTVAFEQRDRVIWQTMTKPVAAWQYLLGKWLGVVGVAAVLLAVAASGVFLFTEYLRNQPALDEVRPYVARDAGIGGSQLTEDRFVLETQVLAARRVMRPVLPELPRDAKEAEYQRRLAIERTNDLSVRDTPETRRRITDEIDSETLGTHLTIGPGRAATYIFDGLAEARAQGRLLSLRYRIRSGGDDPREFYRLSFIIPGAEPTVRESPLDQTLTVDISPAAIDPESGTLELTIVNGDIFRYTSNRATIIFPVDGLELFYSVGGYRGNFVRVALVLWMKLAFLAMVGVVAATFLSFPVASLVAFGVFMMAEASSFLGGSLEFFGGEWSDRDFELWRFVIRSISEPVIWTFQFYSKLRPTSNLVNGRMVDWGDVALTTATIGVFIVILYGIGILIFRRRELATYSGQ